MQPVNDDMDNLFRQAAENYPLNTQGADFDKLLQRMDAAGEEAPPQKGDRRRYGWLLLLLLIPLPFICRHYYTSGIEDKLSAAVQLQDKEEGSIVYPKEITAVPNNETAVGKQYIPAADTQEVANKYKVPANSTPSASSGDSGMVQQSGKKEAVQRNNPQPTAKAGTVKVSGARKLATVNQRVHEKQSDKQGNYNGNEPDGKDKASKKEIKAVSSNEKELASGIALPATERGRQPDSLSKADSTRFVGNKQNDTVNAAMAKKNMVKDSTAADSTALGKKEKKMNEKVKPFFYAGVVAGVDDSVVKSNQTAGTGYNAGLVAGYSFGSHWAIETGLLWAYKKYRAEGKYIDTTGLGIASHTQVMNANGSCGILEIPLLVQYHFGSKSRSHWYAAAGLSSYLIKKEEYYYVGKRYNMVYYAEKEYSNSTKNWFSVLQLGGGYQLQLGKHSSLRAEPYVKLPLSKIGIAKLPLSSAGINIGYTRPL